MNEELIAKLKKLAARESTYEDEDGNWLDDVCIYDYCGGNTDDAYEMGERDGATYIAREVLVALDIPYA